MSLEAGLLGSRRDAFFDRCSKFVLSTSVSKGGTCQGRFRDGLPGLLLGEASHIVYLKGRICDHIPFPLSVVSVTDLITNQIKEFNYKIHGAGDPLVPPNTLLRSHWHLRSQSWFQWSAFCRACWLHHLTAHVEVHQIYFQLLQWGDSMRDGKSAKLVQSSAVYGE